MRVSSIGIQFEQRQTDCMQFADRLQTPSLAMFGTSIDDARRYFFCADGMCRGCCDTWYTGMAGEVLGCRKLLCVEVVKLCGGFGVSVFLGVLGFD